MDKRYVINGWILYVSGKYKEMCKKRGLNPSDNKAVFTISYLGTFIVGIAKPFVK